MIPASCSAKCWRSAASVRWQYARASCASRLTHRWTTSSDVTIWVKICGLTTRDAVEAAVAAGVDAVGFVFAPSKRQVSATQAAQLAQGVPRKIQRVAVMLHPTQSQLEEVWSAFRPDVLQ